MDIRIKLIKTPEDHNAAVALLQAMGEDENFGTSEAQIDDFELLAQLIEDYESKNFHIPTPDPIAVIKLKMDYMGLKRKDLSHIASSGVLSDLFSGKRSLSKTMIRKFSELLNVSQDLLNPLDSIPAGLDKKVETIPPAKVKIKSIFKFLEETTQQIKPFKERTFREGLFSIGQYA
ncbi:hypothetical protein [Pedobacter aquatilis]|uniref:helix-turn-helix domain-containing protein n=1 Tax=Pedobacter aquatilis TaxID=351343 RepID=UPI00292F33D6|nr:hypothetical protein [Pedobacter aquatilis]